MAEQTLDLSTSTETSTPEPARAGLFSVSFIGLLCTQFLGAMNDQILRWLVVPIAKEYGGKDHEAAALMIGANCLVIPFLLFAAHAGYFSDRFSKRSVIIGCKIAELLLFILGLATIALVGPDSYYLMYGVIFLLGIQAAMFSPAKYGSIPEIVKPEKVSAANGVIALSTIIAIVIGTVLGNYLYDITRPLGQHAMWKPAVILISLALLGWWSSTWIARLPAANPTLKFPRNPFKQVWRDVLMLASNRPLLRVALGIVFFWSLASLAQLNVDAYGIDLLNLTQKEIGPLLAILSIGVGVGSVFAGFCSGDRVELGLVPLGALGIVVSACLLYTSESSYGWTCVWLFMLGASAGTFDIPLQSYLQHNSPEESRGSILAASNFVTFTGIILFNVVFFLLKAPLGGAEEGLLTPRGIFLLAGFLTLPVAIYALVLLPQATIRFVVWMASCTIYRVRVVGRENLPAHGGALLVANHVSWLDGILLMLTSSRPLRMMVYADYVEKGWTHWLAKTMGAIPIKPGRKSVVESLRLAREAINRGELVCIFPEGAITRSGQMRAFKPGMMSILKGTTAPVIPIYLDELWGSIFSYERGKFFWKWPRRWPYPVTILFGKAIQNAEDVNQVRRAVEHVGQQAIEKRKARTMILPRLFIRNCRSSLRRSKVADTLGTEMNGGQLLMRALILRRLLLRDVLAADEKYVGVLIPPTAGGVLVNAALPLCQRISVNLNYTASPEVMASCIAQCGIRHVLTTRKVLEKLDIKLPTNVEPVFIEDFRERVTLADKITCAAQAYAMPVGMLERRLGLLDISPDDVLTVIFTSGSTGDPKGVVLSYHNVAANIDAIDQLIKLNKNDVLAGVLPFFHSMGYTATIWTVLTLDPKGVFHTNPLDARQVGEMCHKHRATILIGTPTFLRSYLRRCPREHFTSLEVVVAGAERLPTDLCDAFEEKFGIRPVEGYGTTELSPLAALNVPATRATTTEDQPVLREGTVGRPVPGVVAKIVDLDSGAELGTDQPGMLWIKGPNVMQGYLNKPALTAEVIQDGWYKTGDIALIDADGFIKITGRESRFSKIGGEMVPHIMIEETLQRIVSPDADELRAVVTAVPDARKGERIVVLHTALEKTPEVLCKELAAAGLPNLWIPSPDSFCQVEELPVLGTGKLDLKALKLLALEKFSQPA